MFLTPEQKEIGKENFFAAVGSEYVDRKILKEVAHESLTSKNGLGARYFGYEPIEKPVRVAVLGTGDEGNVLIGALNPKYHDCVAIADVRPYSQYRAFHGDVYSETANSVRPGLMKIYGWKDEAEARQHVKVYADYKELFDAEGENIEAVIIALPLHLHAPAAIEAMKRGYHVLTEKLMGHSVANCKEMGRAAVKYKKHLATGHQRHYNVLYKHANTLINQDVLGEIHYIRAQWHRNNKPFPDNDSWRVPMPKNFKPDDPQASDIEKELKNWQNARKKAVDAKRADEVKLWDLKIAQKEAQLADAILGQQNGGEYNGVQLKNVKEYGYQDETIRDDMRKTDYSRTAGEELIRWRIWDRTGGGMMAELGSHQMDAASIFLTAQKLKRDSNFEGEVHPLSVVASGVRNLFPLDRDADDHVHCLYEYPAEGYDPSSELGRQKKITVAYSSINGNDFDGYGETVFGSKGTLVIEREKDAYLYRTAGVNEKTKVVKGAREELDVANDPEGDKLSAAIGTQGLWGDVSRGYSEELEHWAWCIRKNPNCEDPKVHPKCYPPVALGDAIIALATNIAIQLEQPIEFKPEWFDVADDATPDNEYREVLGKKPDDPDLKPDLKKYGITD